jgi:hypothetical protein
MFTLTFRQLKDQQFAQALGKLANFGRYRDQKVTYNIARMIVLIDQHKTAMREAFLALIKKYAVLDEKGNLKVAEDGGITVQDEKKKEWDEAATSFHEQAVEIKRHKIKLEDLQGVELTPLDLLALEPVMVSLEAV